MTQLVINSRYSLMAISLSQKVDGKFQRRLEVAVGIRHHRRDLCRCHRSRRIDFKRILFPGLISLPILGWSAGTLFGAVLGNIMPEIITTSLGIATLWHVHRRCCTESARKPPRTDHRDPRHHHQYRAPIRSCLFRDLGGIRRYLSAQ